MEKDFKIGDIVQIGSSGQKEKIVNKFQPTGTYSVFTVYTFHDGTFINCAKHELVKGPDDLIFKEMFNEFEAPYTATTLLPSVNPVSTSTVVNGSSKQTSTIHSSSTFPPPPIIPEQPSEIELSPDIAELINNIASNNASTTNQPGRFVEFSDKDLEDFVYQNENDNTRRKTLIPSPTQ